MNPIIIIVAVIFIVVVVAVVAVGVRKEEAAKVGVSDLPPEFDLADGTEAATMSDRDPEPNWPKMFAPKTGRLDDEARLRLIHDLAVVRAAWCVPILQQAYEEEREPELRRAAREALAACEATTALLP